MQEILSSRIIKLIEGVRIAEGLSVADFVTHFDVTPVAYYKWRKSACKGGAPINIRLCIIDRGLKSLGYDSFIIINKAEK